MPDNSSQTSEQTSQPVTAVSHSAVNIITISREYGSGGRDLGAALGAALGWPVLDEDLPVRVANRLRLQPDTVEQWDEHPPSLMEWIGSILLIPQPEMQAPMLTEDIPTHDTVANAARDVITEAGEKPPLIVVGHGAQCIFRDRTDAIHIRVIAPFPDRVHNIAKRLGITAEQASSDARAMDADRAAYIRRYFQEDVRDPLLYDLKINTGRMSIAEATASILALVQTRRSA